MGLRCDFVESHECQDRQAGGFEGLSTTLPSVHEGEDADDHTAFGAHGLDGLMR